MNRKLLAKGASAFAVFVGWSGLAAAQTPPPSAGLDEIVVTAQRRAENLQEVPLTVQAISGEDLEARSVTNLLELQRIAPALTVQDTASNVSPFIRGVGSTVTGAGQSGSVATYVDGVYIATLASAALDLDNVDQVQVLSGPQGALYGRNATGGAIVISTYTPEVGDPFSLRARASYGNYNSQSYSATLASGVGDKAAAALSVTYKSRDGYVENLNPPGFGAHHDDLNDRDALTVQGVLTFEPTDKLSIQLRASRFESKDRFGVGLQAVGLSIPVAGPLNGTQAYYAGVLQSLGVPANNAGAAAAGLQFSNQVGASYDNEANGFSRGILSGDFLPGSFTALELTSASLRVSYSFPGFDLTSLTAYSDAESWSATEIIFANPATYPPGFQGGSIGFSGDFPARSFQQDLQLTSTSGPIDWLAGVTYFEGEGDTDLSGDLPPLSARTALNTWKTPSLAVYGQATFPMTDHVSATVGARYTDEKYETTDRLQATTPFNLFGIPNFGNREIQNSDTTYTARLQYQADTLLVYAGVATGFKAGAFSPVNLGSPPVDPEEITSYEAGFKWDPTDSLRLNASVFRYAYDNIHIAYTDTTSGSNILVNGTSAEVTGLELQGVAQASSWLRLRANALVLDSSYDSDVISSGSVAVLRTSGKRLAGAPELVVGLGADIDITAVESGDLTLAVDVMHNGGYYFDAENLIGTGGADADAFTTLDLRLSYAPDGKPWSFAIFGTNVTDEAYFNSGLSASGILRSALAAPPALYGVSLSLKY